MPPDLSALEADLLQRIPLSARSVLDIGCGRGGLLGAYRGANPTARLLGITDDKAAATIAGRHLDEVAVDGGEQAFPFEAPNRLDCIIHRGPFAHGDAFAAQLRRCADHLSADGVLLLCVPNADHWRNAVRLLRGPAGHDAVGAAALSGHGLEETRSALLAAGLAPCDAYPRPDEQEGAQEFVAAISPALAALGIDPAEYISRAGASHHIWRACRTARSRLIVAGNMLPPVGGVSHVRVVHPLKAMGTDPMVAVQLTDRIETSRADDGLPRIFVLHRPALTGERGHATLRALRAAGWLVVTEFDDHPDFFKALREDPEQLSFRGVHAVQTSTRPLAAALRERNPEVAIFPNAVVSLPEVGNFADPRAMTLFFGALNRERDWAPFMPAINAVAATAGERLRFQVVHDQGFFDALETPHKQFTPTCDYDSYLRLLGRCEISFMPLADNTFNRAKSDLKFIEAASCRAATLASTVVYADCVQDGRTGLLFRDPDELHVHLLRLVAVPDLARGIGDAAREYVRTRRMLAYQVAERIAWYRSLWERREELTAALHERVAERVAPVA